MLVSAALAAASGCKGERVEPTVEDVVDEPLEYAGRTVTLSGEVGQVHGPRSFVLESTDDPFGIWEQELLVVTRSPVRLARSGPLEEGENIVVAGRVESMVVAEIERELKWDLEPEIETEYADEPILIADTISLIERHAYWSERDRPEGEIVGYGYVTTAVAPESLVGQRITLEEVPVLSIEGNNLWVGNRRSARLLVVPRGELPEPLEAGDEIRVQGTLEQMPPAEKARAELDLRTMDAAEIDEQLLYLRASEIQRVSGERSAQR